MSFGTVRRPAASVAQIRSRVIRKLLAIVESDERPEAIVAASRVLLDLPADNHPDPADAAVSASPDKLQVKAAKAIAAAFRELEEPVEVEDSPPLALPPDLKGEDDPTPAPVVEAAKVIEPVKVLSLKEQRLKDPEWRRRHSVEFERQKNFQGLLLTRATYSQNAYLTTQF